jgi:hypothetical protein
MNERIKELAEQAGLALTPNTNPISWFGLAIDLERFAQLVRDDERAKCAAGYLQDFCGAVDAGKIEEREACAKLLDDFAKTEMVPVKDTWRMGVMAAANAVRDKK